VREQLVDLVLGQLLRVQQARTELLQALVAAELLAEARHQLEAA
jgi:hypothetical protein